MMDNSKEGLMFYNKKPSFSSSFDPISEKQEEMSGSSHFKNNKINSKNSKEKFEENITKKIIDDVDFIKHSKTHKNKKIWIINNDKSSLFQIENNKNEEQQNRTSLPKNKKKIVKRNSVQDKNTLSRFSHIRLNNSEIKESLKKQYSIEKQGLQRFGRLSNSFLNQNKSLNNQENSFTHIIFGFNKGYKKQTILTKGRLKFNEKTATSVYDQIKNSELYEKSEILIFKLKICFGILGIFSLISIILNCADSILYNNKSLEYIRNQNNDTFFDKNKIENYYCINNRKISSKENSIRITNGIFCILCTLLIIITYKISSGSFEKKKKNSKKEKFKRMLDKYYNKQRKKNMSKEKSKLQQKEEKDRYEKIKIFNFDLDNEEKNDDKNDKIEINIIIRMCIINIIFYPPYINVAFIGKYYNIIYIYSLNSFFLIISLFKISNLYRAIFYLSPLNNSFNKAICKSNLLSLNFRFMFKYNLNKSPLSFLLLNLIIIFITMCILLSSVEFFSVDINNKFWSDVNENRTENFFHILSVFFFFSIRNVHEDHCIKSYLGKIILLIGGMIGMVISSYFIYYINNLIEFSPEEQIAYSKLIKLLNPINREHKASNLIKSILLIKKIFIDNLNTIKDYREKIQDLEKPKNFQRRLVLQKDNTFNLIFNSKSSSQNRMNLNELNAKEEKRKFIKYIESAFLLKIKVQVELKNFTDNLKVARNSTLSFNDVLKTVGNKMDVNISQLSNKLEVLVNYDQKYIDFIKFTSNTVKKIKKISNIHNSLIQYLTDVHNDHVKQIIEKRKEAEMNSPILYKNSLNLPKRMKSNVFGKMNFKKGIQNKHINNKEKKKKNKKELYDFNFSKFTIKKQRSSLISSAFLQNSALEEKMKQSRSKQNTNKTTKPRNKNRRTKSLEDWEFMKKDKIKGRNSLVKKVERSISTMDKKRRKNE